MPLPEGPMIAVIAFDRKSRVTSQNEPASSVPGRKVADRHGRLDGTIVFDWWARHMILQCCELGCREAYVRLSDSVVIARLQLGVGAP